MTDPRRTMPIRFFAHRDRGDSRSRAPERGSATRGTPMTANRIDLLRTTVSRFVLVSILSLSPLNLSRAEFRAVDRPAVAGTNRFYVSNRAPLEPSPFVKLPIGSITPRGWLRHQLELERDGMTGHLQEISPWLDFTKSAWGNKDGQGERGWEELPYWLKGFGDLGYVLKDETVIAQAKPWIEMMFASQRADGWFGPRALLTSLNGQPDLWPHMVMLNVLQSYYEFSGDPRVIELMTRYFQWQNQLPATAFGEGYWPKIRAGDNIESVFWLYNRTGEAWLLDLAQKIHANMQHWDRGDLNWHNVNFAQGFRAGTVAWMQSKDPRDLHSAESNYEKAIGIYGQFPGGTFVADENARPGYVDPRGGFETCGIVEFMHSFEMLTKITGNPLWADRCEELAFNSLPAALTPDAKGLHYLTCANQIQLDRGNKSPDVQNGGTMFSYSPYEVYRCCQHNVSHGWPYYAEELWLATPDNGLCASLYAASEVSAKVGDGTAVKIVEETGYPFGDSIHLKLTTPRPVEFPLYLRVPRWCDGTALQINGQNVEAKGRPLSFLVVNRQWKDGDTVALGLRMHVAVRKWAKNKDAVSVDYGPLSFALAIKEKWERYGNRNPNWPEWEVLPESPWNYGLVLNGSDPTQSFNLSFKTGLLGPQSQPFTPETTPITMTVQARKIPQWQADRFNVVGPLQQSPAKSDEPVETITLIPMGAARLRIACFPTVSTGADAHEWVAPPKPKPAAYKASASHCNENDTVDALSDGVEPASSNEQSIPRFTWWDHRGTKEWVQYDFVQPKNVSAVSVYWFDDTGAGSCRVPESWRLLYKTGSGWQPVNARGAFGTRRNRFNRVAFAPVETAALRLEVQLKPDFSGGILEWKIE